ncbi:MAG: DnaB-like helicase C-terminal domain-containing protein [Dehalococcoidales bacterium]
MKFTAADIAAEDLLIGAVVLNPAEYYPQAADLSPQSFCHPRNRRIWRAMAKASAADAEFNLLSIAEAYTALGGDCITDVTQLDSKPGHSVPFLAARVAQSKLTRDVKAAAQRIVDSDIVGEEAMSEALTHFESIHVPGGGELLQADALATRIADDLEIRYSHRNEDGCRGISTGFAAIDKLTNGLARGQVHVIGGRPSEGKSSLALAIALNRAYAGGVVDFYSLEDTMDGLGDRIVCRQSRLSADVLRTARLSKAEWTRATVDLGKLAKAKLAVSDHVFDNAAQLCGAIRKHCLRRKTELVIVDYLQMLTPTEEPSDITAASLMLQRTAKRTGAAIILCSQLNRQGADEPRLKHLRGSGAIEQHAYSVFLLWRNPLVKHAPVTALKVAKQKNGRAGDDVWIHLHFDKAKSTFWDCDMDMSREYLREVENGI